MKTMHIQGSSSLRYKYSVGNRLFKTLACARYHAQITNQSLVQISTQTQLNRDIQWKQN